ncbi:MAG: hypothetical protein A3D31_12645 [Candidatus Fluviicola riflensis]|nr:MAG: hypothetical protein CHH17_17085 [Candidatus Fluviicola riflensis]OGS77832.1 MAG: hypothetical protein A3D31_12645 [Candidatus Fluviicola riflensis]OGS84897.1 MAG: hypothetical protein A2724_09580 [Fluviicola sp. RIFCSPHIGHO2_01_FULL_43_53]OGS89169.1 MAG: hypothetical protein A3E30_03885 [Fluviicola sp. RIFCSPHIGHO2_12_FULL_43_24]
MENQLKVNLKCLTMKLMKYASITFLVVIGAGTFFLWPETMELEPQEFSEALQSQKNEILIDLRSEKEFSEGHIPGATNFDWKSPTWKWRIDELDSTCPVFIYCQKGERSARAVAYLSTKGFQSVTLLKDGLVRWSNEKYPLTPQELWPPEELTLKEFSWMLDLEHLVIVDFYLPGDKNCRAIETTLDELAITYSGSIKILRINIDRYKHLATEMGIESVPILHFYENGNLAGQIEGVNGKDRIESEFDLKEYTITAGSSKKQKRPIQ